MTGRGCQEVHCRCTVQLPAAKPQGLLPIMLPARYLVALTTGVGLAINEALQGGKCPLSGYNLLLRTPKLLVLVS